MKVSIMQTARLCRDEDEEVVNATCLGNRYVEFQSDEAGPAEVRVWEEEGRIVVAAPAGEMVLRIGDDQHLYLNTERP